MTWQGKSRAIDSASGTRDVAPQFHGREGFYSTSTSGSSMKSKKVRGQGEFTPGRRGPACRGPGLPLPLCQLPDTEAGGSSGRRTHPVSLLRVRPPVPLPEPIHLRTALNTMYHLSRLVPKLSIKGGLRYFILSFEYPEI